MPSLPPPHDLEAERVMLAAVLWGDLCAHELEADDWWWPEHRAVWAVVAALEETLGCDVSWRLRWWAVLRMTKRLEQRRLLQMVSVVAAAGPRRCVARLKETAERRRAVELLQRAEARVREMGG